MSIESIDTKIRNRARQELKDRVDAASKPIEREIRIGWSLQTDMKDHKGQPISAYECLRAIQRAVLENKVERAEQDAVEAFLAKVDSLQAEVNELRETVQA